MPELKVPDFLVDLYWDLRDRRLLPLVALAIVAIVAVPFLIGGSKSESPEPVAPVAAPSPEPAGSKLTVVEAKPGLRDYHKRLGSDTPTDPFKQPGRPSEGGANGGGSESGVSTTATSTSTTVTSTSGNGTTTTTTESTTGPGGSPSGTVEPGHLTLFAFAIDVKIVRTETKPDGSKKSDEPEIRHRVVPPAALPSEKEQAVTYMGISPKTQAPMLLISDAVTSVFGEANCLSGASTCQLIEVEPDLPMTFVYGPHSVRYKITVLKVEPVVTGHT